MGSEQPGPLNASAKPFYDTLLRNHCEFNDHDDDIVCYSTGREIIFEESVPDCLLLSFWLSSNSLTTPSMINKRNLFMFNLDRLKTYKGNFYCNASTMQLL